MSLGEGCPPTKDMGSGGIIPRKILKLETQFGAFWRQTHTKTRSQTESPRLQINSNSKLRLSETCLRASEKMSSFEV